MLMKGLHKSFSELQELLNLQIAERLKLGSEHPIWDKPLLDQEQNKLDYLCELLNKAEEAERTGTTRRGCLIGYQTTILGFNPKAHQRSSTAATTIWPITFYQRTTIGYQTTFSKNVCCACRTQSSKYSTRKKQLNPIVTSDWRLNVKVKYQIVSKLIDQTSKSSCLSFQDSYFEAMNHFEQYYNLSKDKDWLKTLNNLPYGLINESSTQTVEEQDLMYDKDNRLFTDACINLQRIYKIIAHKYAKTIEDQTSYLTKAYEVCKDSKAIL
jgi:hypothetical protein